MKDLCSVTLNRVNNLMRNITPIIFQIKCFWNLCSAITFTMYPFQIRSSLQEAMWIRLSFPLRTEIPGFVQLCLEAPGIN